MNRFYVLQVPAICLVPESWPLILVLHETHWEYDDFFGQLTLDGHGFTHDDNNVAVLLDVVSSVTENHHIP